MSGPVASDVKDGILHIVLDRPDALNALSSGMREELLRCGDRAAGPDVDVIVLSGRGRAFTAGMDTREMADRAMSFQTLRRHLNPFVLMLQATERPVVAILDGLVVGAGIGIGLSADVRVGGPGTRFLPVFVRQRLVPDSGTTYFTARALGYDRACRWLLTGNEIQGRAALDAGLLTDFADGEETPLEVGMRLAHELAALPSTSTRATLSLLRRAARSALADQLDAEAAATNWVVRGSESSTALPSAAVTRPDTIGRTGVAP